MAVRFNTSGNSHLTRTANLPTSTAFTICGWSKMVANTGNYAAIAVVESNLYTAYNYIQLVTLADGVSLGLYATNTSTSGLATLAVGDVFFWALTANGSGAGAVTGYHKGLNTVGGLSSVTTTGDSFTPGAVFVGSDSWQEPFNGSTWNVKCWDRALTAEELLVESAYERVMYPASLNFHWPLSGTSDLNDRSGNGRAATATGTLTTEDNGGQAWAPSSKIFIPAGAGGISGSLSGTLGDLTGSAAATLPITGAMAVTLGAITAASSGGTDIEGLAAASLAPMTGASDAALSIAAQGAATLGDLTGAAEGVGVSIVAGSVSSTLDAITTTSAAQIQIQASTSGTLSPVTLASQATLAIAAQGAATFGGLTALCAATIADPASPAAPASNSRFIRNFAS